MTKNRIMLAKWAWNCTQIWEQELFHVQHSKKGVFPFVLILPELAALLRQMRRPV